MALIKCPECGKEISDKAPQCIHCGYPLDSTSESIYSTVQPSKFYQVKLVDYPPKMKIHAIKAVRETTGFGLADAKAFVETVPNILYKGLSIEQCEEIQKHFSDISANVSIEPDYSSTEQNTVFKGYGATLPKKESFKSSKPVCPKCG